MQLKERIGKKIVSMSARIFYGPWSRFMPMDKNKILFFTFQYDYTCNPKYICDEILRRKLPWDLVWVAREKNDAHFPEGVRVVHPGTFAYFRELNTAHIWIDNATNCCKTPVQKKPEQILIETMHGSLGIKRIGPEGVTTAAREERIQKIGRYTDACISNSTFENEVYRSTYWKDAKIWLDGHARNDVFFQKDHGEVDKKVRTALGLDADTGFVLYAPTVRPYAVSEVVDTKKILAACKEKFGGKWKFVKKLHPSSKNAVFTTAGEDVIDATDYSDIQELMLSCSVGITDYSSWIYDYVLSRKPGFLFVPDVQQYDQAKGFYYPLSETPFPVCETSEALCKAILDHEDSAYQRRIDTFLQARGCMEDGHAAERIVDRLEELMQ